MKCFKGRLRRSATLDHFKVPDAFQGYPLDKEKCDRDRQREPHRMMHEEEKGVFE